MSEDLKEGFSAAAGGGFATGLAATDEGLILDPEDSAESSDFFARSDFGSVFALTAGLGFVIPASESEASRLAPRFSA
jgi:hypothetical protein